MLRGRTRMQISEASATRTCSISSSEVAADVEAAANNILSSTSVVVDITVDGNNSRRKSYLRTLM